MNPLKRGNGSAPDHWSRGIYGYSSYRRASIRPRLPLLPARPRLGLPGQLSIHLLLAMRSHSLWDFFVLWCEPPFCIWMAAAFCKWMAAATAACISGVVSRADRLSHGLHPLARVRPGAEVHSFPSGHLKVLDAWIAQQKPPVTRPEAIRSLLMGALRVEDLG